MRVAVAVCLAMLALLCLGRATLTEVTARRSGPDVDCGATVLVALKGADLPSGIRGRAQVDERCQRVALKRFVGWSLAGWGLLGGAVVAYAGARSARSARSNDVRDVELN